MQFPSPLPCPGFASCRSAARRGAEEEVEEKEAADLLRPSDTAFPGGAAGADQQPSL